MSIVIKLPEYLYQCPQPWRNMIKAMFDKNTMYEVKLEQIQNEVGQYGGVYNEDQSLLIFKSKEDYDFWRLRWL